MYRILHNWLAKVYGLEITAQWHLEAVCDDGNNHHFYCDLTIKDPDNSSPIALLELLATGSISNIKKHFDQVLKYADQFSPQEIWLVHFSREDSVITNPCWSS